MEVFRYAVNSEWERINREGALKPRFQNGELRPIYAIPESPDRWDYRDFFEMIRWIERISGEPVTILMRFEVPLDPEKQCFVQEGNEGPEVKRENRKHGSLYRGKDFRCPEFIIYEEIPLSAISLVGKVH